MNLCTIKAKLAPRNIVLRVVLTGLVLMGVFTLSQISKGATLEAAAWFATQWTVISLGIFYSVRAYYRLRGQRCKIEKMDH
jgi:hypothetical protein